MTDGIWGRDGCSASRLDGKEFASTEELGVKEDIVLWTTDDISGKVPSERWRFMGGDRICDESCALRLREVEEVGCKLEGGENGKGEGEGQGELDFGRQARLLSKMGRPQPHL